MNLKKLALASGIAATLGVATLPSHAMVYGVAGEAMLAPVVLNDPDNRDTGNMNTYIFLKLPSVLGSDFVLNNYTAPNLRDGVPAGEAISIRPDEWTVHWTWFSPESDKPKNGTCEGSADDVIVWTTDHELLQLQGDVDRGEVPTGPVPRTYCGSATLPEAGYVVFQTGTGADALTANFAMEATAYITDANISEYADPTALLSVPMIPMADGVDPVPSNRNTSPQLGVNEVIQPVTSNGGGQGDGILVSPVVASPLATGIRMNDGDPGTQLATSFAGGVLAQLEEVTGYSMHILWFDRNNDERTATSQVLLWDEHEFNESLQVPIDYELNMILWNASKGCDGDCDVESWSDFGDAVDHDEFGMFVDIIGTLKEGAVQQDTFNFPFNWTFSLMGYAEYILLEEGTELGGPGGTNGTNAAAVAFEAQEDSWNMDAWSQHLMTLRGFR